MSAEHYSLIVGPFDAAALERMLRQEWWMNHGCPPGSAYGDDGEMSCGCGLDAKRLSMPDLAAAVLRRRMERGAAAWEELNRG